MKEKLALAAAILVLIIFVFLSKVPFAKPLISDKSSASKAEIFLEENILKINFKIAKEDEQNSRQISKKLDVTNQWISGMSMVLDDKTAKIVSDSLTGPTKEDPLILNLQFKPESIEFSTNEKAVLKSILPETSYTLSTDSARISYKFRSDKDFELSIDKPLEIINYATASASVRLSHKLQILFPILSKIATIDLKAVDRFIKGEITFVE